MVVTVSPADPRSVRALAVLATADRWTFGHRMADGLAFAIIPASKPGATYFTSAIGCTCPDHRERGGACKHMTALALHRMQHGQVDEPAPRSCRVCGGTLADGAGTCEPCEATVPAYNRPACLVLRPRRQEVVGGVP